MRARCYRPTYEHYKDYGGRGITVCDQWRDSFVTFYAHIGQKPSSKMSLDRIDNNGNYEPGNVRWATKSQQRRNQRYLGRKSTRVAYDMLNVPVGIRLTE